MTNADRDLIDVLATLLCDVHAGAAAALSAFLAEHAEAELPRLTAKLTAAGEAQRKLKAGFARARAEQAERAKAEEAEAQARARSGRRPKPGAELVG
jgi:hypothetical protein